MSLSYVVGNTLVDADEFIARVKDPDAEVTAFANALKATAQKYDSDSDVTLHFSTGLVTLDEFLLTSFRDGVTPFQPVGIGKPATILLRHIYTGRFGKKDMLLTSAVRDPFTTFNMAPRAINSLPLRRVLLSFPGFSTKRKDPRLCWTR